MMDIMERKVKLVRGDGVRRLIRHDTSTPETRDPSEEENGRPRRRCLTQTRAFV